VVPRHPVRRDRDLGLHIQIGREAKSIRISEIPLVIGLFYGESAGAAAGRIIGPALIVLLYRRQTALKPRSTSTLFFANRRAGAGDVPAAVRAHGRGHSAGLARRGRRRDAWPSSSTCWC